jgi:isopentenyl phosphate kinase
MTGHLRIFKVGGAAITDKNDSEKLNREVLEATCRSLSETCGGVDRPIVIVHGAGSFGHHIASVAGVAQGGLESLTVKCGFVDTRYRVTN